MTKKSKQQTLASSKKNGKQALNSSSSKSTIPKGGRYQGASINARINRGNLRDHPIFGSDNYVSNVNSIPASFVNFEGNSTWCNQAGAVKHKYLGIDGISLVGCQPLTDITTTAGNTNLFTTGTLSDTGANSIGFNPDTLNGPLAAQANLHQKYVFRDILIEYVSAVATTQAGAFSLSFSTDGSGVNIPTNFSTNRQTVPSAVIPFRTDRAYLHYHYDGLDTWFTEADNASTAGSRWTAQGALYGFPSVTSLGAISQGYTNLWYVIELYQPVNSQGFTLGLRTQKEYDLVRSYLKDLREKEKNADGVVVDPRKNYWS